MKIGNRIALIGLPILLGFVAFGFAGIQGVSTIEDIAAAEDGEEIYMTRCLSCHMTNGEGVQGVFPPLASSEHVVGDKGVLVRMILNGLRGEVVVDGVTYNGMMPPWGGFLDDEQVAAVTTYIRSNFGNDAEAITTEEVAKVRAAVGERSDAWTMEELSKPENQGIPGSE